jgi:hypothetical protein
MFPKILNCERKENIGGWNTNNYVESIFKNIIYFVLNGKGNLRISSLLQIIIERVNSAVEIKIVQKKKQVFEAKKAFVGKRI